MKSFNSTYSTLFETYANNVIELTPTTTMDDIINSEQLICYHSSDKLNLSINSQIHVGSKDQAMRRADYKVNDNEEFELYYLHKLIISPSRIYPKLIDDDGGDHESDIHSELSKDYDVVIYKNVGEGLSKKYINLSLIILNPPIIKSIKMIEVLDGELLDDYVNSL